MSNEPNLYIHYTWIDELDRRRARLRRQNIALGALAFVLAASVGVTPIVLKWLDLSP